MKSLCLFMSLFLMSTSVAQMLEGDYELLSQRLHELSQKYKHVEEFVLTISEAGIPVYGIRVQGKSSLSGMMVNQLVVGGHHGNEWSAVEVALKFAENLSQEPLESKTIFIIPALIPETFMSRSREYSFERMIDGKGYIEKIDPNRDYPGPCGSHDQKENYKDRPFLLKTTKSLAEFIEKENIITTISLHSPWGSAHYPWSFDRKTYPKDREIYLDILNQAFSGTSYSVGTVPDSHYNMFGNYIDFAYWEYGVWSYLIELKDHIWSEIRLQFEGETLFPALRSILKKSPILRSLNHQLPTDIDCNL